MPEKPHAPRPTIRRAADSDEFFISEQCHIRELSNREDDPMLSVAQARVEPGVSTRWHVLDGITERYLILSGTGTVEVGDLEPQQVVPGDVVTIPPQCRQRIHNRGHEDLVFLALCTPRFVPEAYREIT